MGHHPDINADFRRELESLIAVYSRKDDLDLTGILASHSNRVWSAEYKAAEHVLKLRATAREDQRYGETHDLAKRAIGLSESSNSIAEQGNKKSKFANLVAVISLTVSVISLWYARDAAQNAKSIAPDRATPLTQAVSPMVSLAPLGSNVLSVPNSQSTNQAQSLPPIEQLPAPSP